MKHFLPKFSRTMLLLALIGLLALPAAAQVLDPAFQATDLRSDFLTNNYIIRAMAVQPNGKVVVSGDYDFLDGVLTSSIRRLNADGTPDATFLTPTGSGPDSFYATALALQPDGKIIAAGQFNYYNGVHTGGLVRLNVDGSLDATFNAGGAGFVTGVGGSELRSLAVQPDGKILVGGTLSTYNGTAVGNLVRLTTTGALDTGFAPAGNGLTNSSGINRIDAILVQADAKVVVGGILVDVAGTGLNGLARLLPNGALDASFAVGTGVSGPGIGSTPQVRALVQQPNGKLLVGGTFTQFNTTPNTSLLRLNLDGTVDPSFQSGVLPTGGGIYHLRLRLNGSVLATGQFATYNGVACGSLALLSSSGVPDATFATGTGANAIVYDLVDLPSGQRLAGGAFTSFQGVAHTGLARLSATGVLDASYHPVHARQGTLDAAVPQANGQLVVGGRFTSFNGTPVPAGNLVRLSTDGSFNALIPLARTGTYFVQPDGLIYILGPDINGVSTLSRLLPAGMLDGSFAPVTLTTAFANQNTLTRLWALPNGLVLLSGNFSTVNGVARPGVARLLGTGVLDPAFVPTATWTGSVYSTVSLDAVQTDGKPLLKAYGNTGTLLTRLNTDGTPDATFGTGGTLSATDYFTVYALPTGQLLQAGIPTSFLPIGSPRFLTRLQADGSPDPSFTTAPSGDITVQPDGRLLVASLDYATGYTQLRRLETNGRPDPSFATVTIPTGYFYGTGIIGTALQPADGKIIIYGGFALVNGQLRVGLARLTNTLLAARPALVAAPALAVYPNPARSTATLRLSPAPAARPVQLLDALGRPVRAFTLPAHAAEALVDVAGLPAGVYVLRCAAASQKLIVE